LDIVFKNPSNKSCIYIYIDASSVLLLHMTVYLGSTAVQCLLNETHTKVLPNKF